MAPPLSFTNPDQASVAPQLSYSYSNKLESGTNPEQDLEVEKGTTPEQGGDVTESENYEEEEEKVLS